ncbi:hypothetical protein C8J57DRAFT_1581860 [Mycena rebaudengoi]|nr:hypothetical protein C8J57DRAFT_1581860 [Mycena rebaudengoi]
MLSNARGSLRLLSACGATSADTRWALDTYPPANQFISAAFLNAEMLVQSLDLARPALVSFVLPSPTTLKMQFKTTSFVALAVWFAGAANASALSARVGPVAQVAIAHVQIHPILNPTLCVTPTGVGEGSPVVVSPCASPLSPSQIWGVNTLDNARIVQFQNTANNLCFEMQFDAFNGQIVTNSGCSNSDGSGRPVSNTEFDTSPQTISPNNLPMVLTAINNRIHFANTNFCVQLNGNGLIFEPCNGGLAQTWLLTSSS